jgi:adenylate cyclase
MDAEQRDTLTEWLVRQGLDGANEDAVVRGLCERLVDAGVPLQRAFVAIDILHPIVEGRSTRWVRSTGTERLEYTRFDFDEHAWTSSPLFALETTGSARLRRRVGVDYVPGEFPLIDDVIRDGGTDYLALCTTFDEPDPIGGIDCVYGTFASDRPGGFPDDDLALLEQLMPTLALTLKALSAAWTARALMETYLGHDAGRRVVRGDIERGATQTIRAIIWLSDLRGFTRIADAIPREDLVPLLNDYADCLVTTVHEHGGHVLKFMGDGLLATFALDDVGAACMRTLDAAQAALTGVGELNARRERDGLPTTAVGLALHLGDVLYGNIGSLERLDFTVVGPAVNEAARIEAMCGSLEQPVIVSSAFVDAAPESRDRLVSLGRYMLRGVSRPQELFTLDPDARSTST